MSPYTNAKVDKDSSTTTWVMSTDFHNYLDILRESEAWLLSAEVHSGSHVM